jgi:hypothetical protein
MPILREANPHFDPRALDHPHYIVIHHVGPGPLGPFNKVPEGLTHLLIAIDKFTKWTEPRPLAKIGSKQTVNFIRDIIFCFRVPKSIITDNGTQFIGERFLDFCDDNNI